MPEQQENTRDLSVAVWALAGAVLVLVTLAVFISTSVSSTTHAQSNSGVVSQSPLVKSNAATAVGARCVSCHKNKPYAGFIDSFLLETHGKTAKLLSDSRAATCETCHGDGTKHIENRENGIAAADIDNPSELKTTEQRRRANARCLECHSGDRDHFSWHGGEHDRSDMSCMSCHNVHHAKFAFGALASQQRALINGAPADASEIKTPDKMLIGFSIEETCFTCHADKRKAFFQRSTHLFRSELHNMKVGCTSCHNPHGGEGGRMLKDFTVNNVCYACHAEKRGPFLWDHPPVRENCLNCHSPHGSNNPKLLTARAHMVCQQCHIHMLPRHSTTAGKPLDIWTINRGCMNCHSQVHGSNHPGGRTLTR